MGSCFLEYFVSSFVVSGMLSRGKLYKKKEIWSRGLGYFKILIENHCKAVKLLIMQGVFL